MWSSTGPDRRSLHDLTVQTRVIRVKPSDSDAPDAAGLAQGSAGLDAGVLQPAAGRRDQHPVFGSDHA